MEPQREKELPDILSVTSPSVRPLTWPWHQKHQQPLMGKSRKLHSWTWREKRNTTLGKTAASRAAAISTESSSATVSFGLRWSRTHWLGCRSSMAISTPFSWSREAVYFWETCLLFLALLSPGFFDSLRRNTLVKQHWNEALKGLFNWNENIR